MPSVSAGGLSWCRGERMTEPSCAVHVAHGLHAGWEELPDELQVTWLWG